MTKVKQFNWAGAIQTTFSKKTDDSGQENYTAYLLCPDSLPSLGWPVLPG